MREVVESIEQAINILEAHLESEITIAQVADSIGYSLFHFIRMFNRVVHYTPYDYLTRRRLSEAARALAAGSRRIADISQDFGFNNQESFSRAFRRMFDQQPSQWRETHGANSLRLIPPITLADLLFRNREGFTFPERVSLAPAEYHGLMTALDPGQHPARAQRERLIADLRPWIKAPAACAEITTYVTGDRQRAYLFAGVTPAELQPGAPSAPALPAQRLAGGEYIKMRAAPEEQALALDYLYYTWFPQNGGSPLHPAEYYLPSPGGGAVYLPAGEKPAFSE